MSLLSISRLFELVVPPRGTERIVEKLTPDELAGARAGEGLPYADKRVQALVWELKYYANRRAAALAGEALAEELAAIASEELGRPLLIPVPMHRSRMRERGHSQTELLCEAALGHLGGAYEYAPGALARVRMTPEQRKLGRAGRLKNVAGSMAADASLVEGRVCVVADDVATTGATLKEAARALREAGAARVRTVALAHS